MDLKSTLGQIFSFGYGLEEWKRDRHAFAVVIISWLAVDTTPFMTGHLDGPTFKAHAILAASIGLTSFLKNLITNNQDPPLKP